MKAIIRFKGGPGSGHHGHTGRPGKRGGSTSGGGSGSSKGSSKASTKHSKVYESTLDKGVNEYSDPYGNLNIAGRRLFNTVERDDAFPDEIRTRARELVRPTANPKYGLGVANKTDIARALRKVRDYYVDNLKE